MIGTSSQAMETRKAAQQLTDRPSRRPRSAGRALGWAAKRVATDGPYAESKELVLGHWPAEMAARPLPPVGDTYATVNGLRMYYEVHGTGRPLVLLHGGLSTIGVSFGHLVRTLACGRQVIAIEQQAHGRTADIDRALTCERMADDTAELLRQLGIERADFFGFSMGATTSLQLAVRHPRLVRKQAVVSGSCNNDGYEPHAVAGLMKNMESDADGSIYDMLRPELERLGVGGWCWRRTVGRMKEVIETGGGLSAQDLRSIEADTLFVAGIAGIVRRDHVEAMGRVVRRAQVKIFPGDDHDPSVVGRSAALLPAFLDASPRPTPLQ
jgi:pimeloyl-ACP methyl ester carboxylesterase